MTCDQAIELLPWLLNGTLGAEEREGVRQHLKTCERCREALIQTREAWQAFDQHLPSEALVALAWGEPPAGLDPALAEAHLAICPQCTAELELARTSRRLEEDDRIAVFPGRPVSKETSRGYRGWRSAALAASFAGVMATVGWFNNEQEIRSLETRLREQPRVAEAPAAKPPVHPAPAPAPVQGEPVESSRVAELTAQVQELGTAVEESNQRTVELEQRLRRLTAPQINSVVADAYLTSGAEERGGATAESVIPSAKGATLLLPANPEGQSGREREVRVLDASRKVIWQMNGLLRNRASNDYTITFPPGFLEPGRYTLQLYAPDGTPQESYKIRVE